MDGYLTTTFHDISLFLAKCHVVIGKKRFYFFFEQCKLKDKIEFSTFTALNGDIIRKISVKVFLLLPTQS